MTAAIVLSAGLGTRLRPLTDELAKPLMPVGDRPMLAHALAALRSGGVGEIAVNIHHLADDFARQIQYLGADVRVLHEPRILGTAGGIANARAALGPGDIVAWNGDIWAPDLDVAELVARRSVAGVEAMWVVEPARIGEGTVGLDADAFVVRLRGERWGKEASGGNFLGIQVLGAALRDRLPAEGCLVGDVALPLLRAGGRVGSFTFRAGWEDVGRPDALLRANLRWLEREGRSAWCAADAIVAPGVTLDRAVVGAGASVTGAGVLRECVVFPGARLEASAERTLAARRTRVWVAPSG